jgi:hypothetical protein
MVCQDDDCFLYVDLTGLPVSECRLIIATVSTRLATGESWFPCEAMSRRPSGRPFLPVLFLACFGANYRTRGWAFEQHKVGRNGRCVGAGRGAWADGRHRAIVGEWLKGYQNVDSRLKMDAKHQRTPVRLDIWTTMFFSVSTCSVFFLPFEALGGSVVGVVCLVCGG